MDTKLLGIYLNDHLAGSRVGIELAHRIEKENRGNPVGDYLAAFIAEIEQDREVLEQLIRKVGAPRGLVKEGLAFIAERVGRLKLNGRLVSYSPLSRFVELEALCLGVEGKLSMWRALSRLARTEPLLKGYEFEALAARSEAQRQALERLRLQAADHAFSDTPAPLRPVPAHGRR